MTVIDWVIVVFVLALAVHGWAQGFIVGVLSLVGFALGALIGTRLAPLVLHGGAHSKYAPLFGLLGALLAGGIIATGFEGMGWAVRKSLVIPGLKAVDGALGAILTACVGLGIAWIVGAVALESANSRPLRLDIQRSAILKALNSILPPSGAILHALARFDPLPALRGPAAGVPAPQHGIVAARGVRLATGSVVRILGTACGLGVEGSGWVAAPGIIVTNAHVVAGESDTIVQVRGTGPSYNAAPLAFDPHDDIAILRVPQVTGRPLKLAPDPSGGTEAAILGFPQDGPFDREPARIGQTQDVSTEDAYGQGPVTRSVTPLRGLVRPGNSGGPLVDAGGDVVGTVFAATTDSATPGGFAVPNALVSTELEKALHGGGRVVSTGPCAG